MSSTSEQQVHSRVCSILGVLNETPSSYIGKAIHDLEDCRGSEAVREVRLTFLAAQYGIGIRCCGRCFDGWKSALSCISFDSFSACL